MYKKINTDKDKIGLYLTSKYLCYTLKSEEYRLYVCSIEDESEIIFISEEKKVNYYSIYGDNLIYISRDEDSTFLVNLKSKNKNQIDEILYDLVDNYYKKNENYYCDNNHVYIYDLLSGNIVKIIKKTIIGYPKLGTDDYIITNNNIYIYVYLKTDFSLLWQKEMRDFFNNEEDSKNNQLQIQEIYAYKDTFIVVTTFGTVCLKQVDGSLIWKTDSYARTMEIVGNIGYVCTSLSLYKINLDTGEESGYGWIHDRLPDFEYGDRSYWPAGHRVVYHNGFLWYLVYDAGDSFIIAINPETGDYEWIHKVDTYEKADEIQFYENKMFVSDTGGYLHIYEKEDA